MEKYYYELSIQPSLYYELFLDLASSLTHEAIEECDETIIIRSEDSLEDVEAGILAFAQELSLAFQTQIDCKTVLTTKKNEDWILTYQQSVQPIEIGEFYIHPSWCEAQAGRINIVVDPTLAFGSGHHETTNRCLKAIEKYVKPQMKVCDVGTGSGILGIAAAKLGAMIDICDTDKVALEDALKNFNHNGVEVQNYWEGSASGTQETYDVVIANIVADVLVMIAKDLVKITKKDGLLILSGIMEQYQEKVKNKYSKTCELVEELHQNEWVTLVMKKREE